MTSGNRILATLGIAVVLAAWPYGAIATGPPCAGHADFAGYLAAVYGERVIGRGLRSDGLLLEVFSGPNGSWTIIVTHPAGLSCLAADGAMWETVPDQPHDSAAPSPREDPSGSLAISPMRDER